MAQRRINAHSRDDVNLLADAILDAPSTYTAALLAHVVDMRLMKLDFGGPITNAMVAVIRWRGVAHLAALFRKLMAKDALAVVQAKLAVVAHCRHGHDFEDLHSAGGWSQREIDLLQSRIKFTMLEQKDDEHAA